MDGWPWWQATLSFIPLHILYIISLGLYCHCYLGLAHWGSKSTSPIYLVAMCIAKSWKVEKVGRIPNGDEDFGKGSCSPYMVIWKCYFMQINVAVHLHIYYLLLLHCCKSKTIQTKQSGVACLCLFVSFLPFSSPICAGQFPLTNSLLLHGKYQTQRVGQRHTSSKRCNANLHFFVELLLMLHLTAVQHTQRKVLSTLFCTHKITEACDWLGACWLTGHRQLCHPSHPEWDLLQNVTIIFSHFKLKMQTFTLPINENVLLWRVKLKHTTFPLGI